MPKKVLIALPPAMLAQVDFVAGIEHRTRSDLIREALRRYLMEFQKGGNVLPLVDVKPLTESSIPMSERKAILENKIPLAEKFPHLATVANT